MFVIPTLSVLYAICGRPDGPGFLKDADTLKYVKPQFRGLLEMAPAESKLSCDAAPQAIRQLVAAKGTRTGGNRCSGSRAGLWSLPAQGAGASRQRRSDTDGSARCGDVSNRARISNERSRANQNGHARRSAARGRRSVDTDSRHREHRRDLEAGRARSACSTVVQWPAAAPPDPERTRSRASGTDTATAH